MDIYDVFYIDKSIYIAMEFLETDLTKLMSMSKVMFKPEVVKNIIKQVLEGVAFLHENFIMHRVTFSTQIYRT